MLRSTGPVIGIIGDGQLALMLAEALLEKNYDFRFLKSSPNSPMMRAFPEKASIDENHFRESCSTFTLENEFLSTIQLKDLLQEKSDTLFPDLPSYQHFEDKISQRSLYQRLGLRSPRWMPLTNKNDISLALKKFSFPFVLKAAQGGYDGKGVHIIGSMTDFELGLQVFGLDQGKTLLIEEYISIKRELAQGFLRKADSRHILLPLVDTIQENGVCNFVHYPAEASQSVVLQISGMLEALINSSLVGIFNFEFFVDHHETVYINEGAPRPHNSQHLTIDASDYSQFDLLAKFLADEVNLPIVVTTKPSAMVNILGQSSGNHYQLHMPLVTDPVTVHPKLYNKEVCSPGRKMGHINVVDETGISNLKIIAQKLFREYRI